MKVCEWNVLECGEIPDHFNDFGWRESPYPLETFRTDEREGLSLMTEWIPSVPSRYSLLYDAKTGQSRLGFKYVGFEKKKGF